MNTPPKKSPRPQQPQNTSNSTTQNATKVASQVGTAVSSFMSGLFQQINTSSPNKQSNPQSKPQQKKFDPNTASRPQMINYINQLRARLRTFHNDNVRLSNQTKVQKEKIDQLQQRSIPESEKDLKIQKLLKKMDQMEKENTKLQLNLEESLKQSKDTSSSTTHSSSTTTNDLESIFSPPQQSSSSTQLIQRNQDLTNQVNTLEQKLDFVNQKLSSVETEKVQIQSDFENLALQHGSDLEKKAVQHMEKMNILKQEKQLIETTHLKMKHSFLSLSKTLSAMWKLLQLTLQDSQKMTSSCVYLSESLSKNSHSLKNVLQEISQSSLDIKKLATVISIQESGDHDSQVSLLSEKLSQVQSQLNSVSIQLSESKSNYESLLSQHNSLVDSNAQSVGSFSNIQSAYQETQTTLETLQTAFSKLESTSKTLESENSSLISNNSILRSNLETLESKISKLQNTLKSTENQVTQTELQVAEKNTQLGKLRTQLSDFNSQILTLTSLDENNKISISKLESSNKKLKNTIHTLESQNATAQQDIIVLNEKLVSLRSQSASDLKLQVSKLDATKNDLVAAVEKQSETEDKLLSSQKSVQLLTDQLLVAQTELKTSQNALEQAQKLQSIAENQLLEQRVEFPHGQQQQLSESNQTDFVTKSDLDLSSQTSTQISAFALQMLEQEESLLVRFMDICDAFEKPNKTCSQCSQIFNVLLSLQNQKMTSLVGIKSNDETSNESPHEASNKTSKEANNETNNKTNNETTNETQLLENKSTKESPLENAISAFFVPTSSNHDKIILDLSTTLQKLKNQLKNSLVDHNKQLDVKMKHIRDLQSECAKISTSHGIWKSRYEKANDALVKLQGAHKLLSKEHETVKTNSLTTLQKLNAQYQLVQDRHKNFVASSDKKYIDLNEQFNIVVSQNKELVAARLVLDKKIFAANAHIEKQKEKISSMKQSCISLEQSIKSLTAQKNQLQDNKSILEATVASLESSLEASKLKIQQHETSIQEFKQLSKDTEQKGNLQFEKISTENDSLTNLISQLKGDNKSLTSSLEKIQIENKELHSNMQSLALQLSNMNHKSSALQQVENDLSLAEQKALHLETLLKSSRSKFQEYQARAQIALGEKNEAISTLDKKLKELELFLKNHSNPDSQEKEGDDGSSDNDEPMKNTNQLPVSSAEAASPKLTPKSVYVIGESATPPQQQDKSVLVQWKTLEKNWMNKNQHLMNRIKTLQLKISQLEESQKNYASEQYSNLEAKYNSTRLTALKDIGEREAIINQQQNQIITLSAKCTLLKKQLQRSQQLHVDNGSNETLNLSKAKNQVPKLVPKQSFQSSVLPTDTTPLPNTGTPKHLIGITPDDSPTSSLPQTPNRTHPAPPLSPAEFRQKIMEYAKTQSAHQPIVLDFKRQISLLESRIQQQKALLDHRSRQQLMLKEELKRANRFETRKDVNLQYLKNVVVKYIISQQHEHLVPVLAQLLQFSDHEMKQIKAAIDSRQGFWGKASSLLWNQPISAGQHDPFDKLGGDNLGSEDAGVGDAN